MNVLNKKSVFILIILVAIGVSVAITGWMLNRQFTQKPPVQTSGTGNIKTYTNAEYGFEFQYPENWSFHANTFYSPFSKFNLIATAPGENVPNTIIPSILINIVTPDFADRAFYDLRHTALDIIVAGATGLKYEYEFEGFSRIAVVIPFGKYRMILGTKKEYENVFNQILATFKFFTSTLKTYRNEEWGFEFRYPQNFLIRENLFVSYYSKFNLDVAVKKEKYFDSVFDLNIVLPEFPDRSFKNVEKTTSEAIVDGVPGIKYEYEFEEQQEIAIILPLGEYKIILGTDSKQDLDIFNQILATFKFIK